MFLFGIQNPGADYGNLAMGFQQISNLFQVNQLGEGEFCHFILDLFNGHDGIETQSTNCFRGREIQYVSYS